MTRLLAALGIVLGALLLALVVGLASSIRVFGYAVFGMFMLMVAPLCLVFGLWLREQGYRDYAKYAMVASAVMFIGAILQYKLPDLAPGSVGYVKSWFSRMEQHNRRAALEGMAPKPVPCGVVLVGADSETLYWFHPSDDPLICYDKAGEQPQGRGELLPVTQALAQIIERQRLRPVAVVQPPTPPLVPTPSISEEQVRELVRVELAKTQPSPTPVPITERPPSRGAWLEVPSTKPD